MNCPKCGKEMEHGYFHVPVFGGIEDYEWSNKKVVPSMTLDYAKKEVISQKRPHQIEGFRCQADKIIVFSYESW